MTKRMTIQLAVEEFEFFDLYNVHRREAWQLVGKTPT